MANIYLHYVFDLWAQWRNLQTRGDVVVVRFADDFVVGFEHRADAERFLAELRARFERFGLVLHPDKTRLVEFGRFADRDRHRHKQGKPETFAFLGFTHICTKTKSGAFTVLRQTMKAKLGALRAELRQRMHRPVPEGGRVLALGGCRALSLLRSAPQPSCARRLPRRIDPQQMATIAQRWLPRPEIFHPYPLVRFGVITQGKSRMR